MRRFPTLCSRIAPVILLVLVWLSAARTEAAVTLFDRDGWTFQTTGLVAAHYQLLKGDADPLGNGKNLAGGRVGADPPSSDKQSNTITQSDMRSGFIGTQIGFSVNRQISQEVRVESLLAANVNGINSNRGQDTGAPKAADYREAWAQIVSPYGTLKFGRMFGLFASSSAAVVAMAYQYGVGHPCSIDSATIACGSVGAGPLYAGFDAAIRYSTPRLGGFQLQVSVTDPNVGNVAKMSPTPRVDTDLNFDYTFGATRLRGSGQTMWNRIEDTNMHNPALALTTWGVMGTLLADIGPFSAGGGAWTGAGVGERIPLEAPDPGNPLAWDRTGALRKFLGVYGNAQINFGGSALTVGGGELFVKLTDYDLSMANTSQLVLTDQYEGHVTFTHRFADCIIANVEFMRWHSDWQADPTDANSEPLKQSLNFMGAGMNYVW